MILCGIIFNFFDLQTKPKSLFMKTQKINRYIWTKSKLSGQTKAFYKNCLKMIVKVAQGIMLWGCMSGKDQNILEHSRLPKLYPFGDFIFEQDGASCHTDKSTKIWMGEHNKILSHPSSSRILIQQTLWHKMKQCMKDNPHCSLPQLITSKIQAKTDITPY